jgi:hypothetical protein
MKSILPTLVAAAVLSAAGCGANSTTTASLPSTDAGKTAGPTVRNGAGTGTVTLSFKIPSRPAKATAARTRPQYVSASTQSVSVGVDGANPAVATSNCSAGTCTVTLALSAGNHALAVRLWDAANAGGNELASNTAGSCTIVADTANACSITLYGLATSVQIASASANVSGSQGSGFTYVSGAATPFTVVALDADNNQILGAGTIAPAVSTTGTGFTIATPAPNAAPTSAPVYTITDTNPAAQTLALSATPAPNSDGANVSSNVTLTGASPFAGSLYYFSGSTFLIASATTGQTALSITSPVSGAPLAAASGNTVLLNGAGSANLYFFDTPTTTITHTIAAGCSSLDNVPIAADGGLFFYECSGTARAYDSSGTLLNSWSDGESGGSGGYIAAGGGFVYTIVGTTVRATGHDGSSPTTFTVSNFPSPVWAIAASSQGLFIANGTTTHVYSPQGALLHTLTTTRPSCDFQPVGNYLTVKTGGNTFTTYNIATGASFGTVTTALSSSDCRVGFSN